MEEKFFSTSELGLAAALIVWGYRIKCIKKKDGKAEIYFISNKGLSELNQDTARYWDSELYDYFMSLKMLKSRIHSS